MNTTTRFGALVLALALAAAGCSSDSSSDSGSSDSGATDSGSSDSGATDSGSSDSGDAAEVPAARPVVKIGSVNSLTGPAPFPEASVAAQAVFDRYNANPEGVVTIEYSIEDDTGDPAVGAQAARKLVSQDGVAMMAGAASLVDCAVNGPFYAENNINAVQGTGVDLSCFTQPNISPVNTGPFAGLTVSLYFASEVLGHDSICYYQFDVGVGTDAQDEAIARWTAITGKDLTIFELYTPGDDFTPYVTQASDLGCTIVMEGGLDVTAIAWDAAVAGQGATFDSIHFTSAYSQAAADGIGSPATATYANSEFEPFSDPDSPALTDWVELMDAAGVAKTSFAEGGYLAGLITIQILESAGIAEGDDVDTQRDKIHAAVLAMEPFDHPMLGSTYTFGDAPGHASNQASKFVQLVDGQWTTVTDEFIVLTDFE